MTSAPSSLRTTRVADKSRTDPAVIKALTNQLQERLLRRIAEHQAKVGIVGLGYVGLPLACLFAEVGFPVLGFDTDASKLAALSRGESYIEHISSARVAALRQRHKFQPCVDFKRLRDADILIICVPTPLTSHREPDLQFISRTGALIAEELRSGQLIILESSTYPGTTRDVLKPILEMSNLRSGADFFLAYSPEREDPGNEQYSTASVPKIVGGDCVAARELAEALYRQVVIQTVPVSNPETAELVKLTENIFRAVNIALVNELKIICTAMDIDVWEVIGAATTKPFGYMPFYPGPGLGGHCIPIDPFYLTWKAREFGINTKFIELAGEVNASMPGFVIEQLTLAMNERQGKALNGARILLLGIAYKKNVDDLRESPGLTIFEILQARGVDVVYHDPHISEIKETREHKTLSGCRSRPLTVAEISAADAVLIVTDHDDVDYRLLARHAKLIVDTRNIMARAGIQATTIVKA